MAPEGGIIPRCGPSDLLPPTADDAHYTARWSARQASEQAWNQDAGGRRGGEQGEAASASGWHSERRRPAVQRASNELGIGGCPLGVPPLWQAGPYYPTVLGHGSEGAGCPGRIPHDLRRTAMRILVRAGVPERASMPLTGHKTNGVFERCSIVSDTGFIDAARKLVAATIGRSGKVEDARSNSRSARSGRERAMIAFTEGWPSG